MSPNFDVNRQRSSSLGTCTPLISDCPLTENRFVKRVEAISKEEARVSQSQPDQEDRATSYVLATQESDGVITDPREYQLELFERAKQQNTIAVLDTGSVFPEPDYGRARILTLHQGSGKTMIAVLLLRYILDQELELRGVGRAPRIAFFVVSGFP